MKKIKLIFICFFVLSNLIAQKKTLNDKLITCLNEPKFQSWFSICEKEIDTVYIYDNTKKFDNFKPIKTKCNKVLKIQSSSIKIDVNIYNPNNTDKIVLYNYEKRKGTYKIYFLNILNNANMIIELNSANQVISYSTGIF